MDSLHHRRKFSSTTSTYSREQIVIAITYIFLLINSILYDYIIHKNKRKTYGSKRINPPEPPL